MERLCDILAQQIEIACDPCRRRGVYRLDRLRRRFGEHASIWDVYLKLTQTCRYQREPGSRTSDQYGMACRAKIDTLGLVGPRGLPSRT